MLVIEASKKDPACYWLVFRAGVKVALICKTCETDWTVLSSTTSPALDCLVETPSAKAPAIGSHLRPVERLHSSIHHLYWLMLFNRAQLLPNDPNSVKVGNALFRFLLTERLLSLP